MRETIWRGFLATTLLTALPNLALDVALRCELSHQRVRFSWPLYSR